MNDPLSQWAITATVCISNPDKTVPNDKIAVKIFVPIHPLLNPEQVKIEATDSRNNDLNNICSQIPQRGQRFNAIKDLECGNSDKHISCKGFI